MTSPGEEAPDKPCGQGRQVPVAPAHAASARRALAEIPLLAEQSSEETDSAWGEYTGSADDRLTRDRPPHWDDF